ncbi:MAG: diguanylate cyclase [Acidobacteriota bacterium]
MSEQNNRTWTDAFPIAITVCDGNGVILEMNEKSAKTFEDDGGRALVGSNVLDCHPEPARSKLQELLDTQGTNVYTIEKHGVRKLIYQGPWYQEGRYAGLVELSIELPQSVPHFVREGARNDAETL